MSEQNGIGNRDDAPQQEDVRDGQGPHQGEGQQGGYGTGADEGGFADGPEQTEDDDEQTGPQGGR